MEVVFPRYHYFRPPCDCQQGSRFQSEIRPQVLAGLIWVEGDLRSDRVDEGGSRALRVAAERLLQPAKYAQAPLPDVGSQVADLRCLVG